MRMINRILDGLYLGNVNASKERDLERHHIGAVVTIIEQAQPSTPTRYYLCIDAEDRDNVNLISHFAKTNEFIHSARLSGLSVLVHCQMGISRSATVMLAYLMSALDISFADAIQYLEVRRYGINPNPGFKQQLKEYECMLAAGSAKKLGDALRMKDRKFMAKELRKSDEGGSSFDYDDDVQIISYKNSLSVDKNISFHKPKRMVAFRVKFNPHPRNALLDFKL